MIRLAVIADLTDGAVERRMTDPRHVAIAEGYARRWRNGERWPAIELWNDGSIADGIHRVMAAVMLGLLSIEVENVVRG